MGYVLSPGARPVVVSPRFAIFEGGEVSPGFEIGELAVFGHINEAAIPSWPRWQIYHVSCSGVFMPREGSVYGKWAIDGQDSSEQVLDRLFLYLIQEKPTRGPFIALPFSGRSY